IIFLGYHLKKDKEPITTPEQTQKEEATNPEIPRTEEKESITNPKSAEQYLEDNQPALAKQVLIQEENTQSIIYIRTLINLRDFEGAKTQLESLDQDQYITKYYKGILEIIYKNFEEANKIFNEIEKSAESDTPPSSEILEKTKNFSEKSRLFSYFREGDPLYIQTLLAKALTESEEYDAAIPLLYDVINQKNNYRDAWIILGYAYLKTNKITDAIDSLSQAETLNPSNPQTLFFLGLAYYANSNLERAAYYLEEAEKTGFEPKDIIHLKLGEIYELQKKSQKAAQRYEMLITLNKSNIDAFIKVVYLNIEKLSRPEKALSYAEQALNLFPDNPMSYNLIAWAQIELEDYKTAKKNLEAALRLQPDFDAAHLNFGRLYEKKGSLEIAKDYYQKAITLGHGNSISELAQEKYDKLNSEQNKNLKANISSP
ncbi:tetratricopeptide repeat protein, partial [Patescibacteria group bacterium]|nr:tetratricopeptide repeat protein [Patescibacteria group bacterium]